MVKKFCFLATFAISSFCFGENNLELLISKEEIAEKICEIGQKIKADYQGKDLTILMVMKGAVCVTADLMRSIDLPFKVDYLKASSYGNNGMIGGELTIIGLDKLAIEGRDVLIVDDIFETGNTMLSIQEKLKEKNPKSIKTLVLLMKDVPRKTEYRPEYVLFDIEDHFVVGYGLDYKEFYRGLPGIYFFPNDTPPF